MPIRIVNGDLLDSQAQVIAHQTNCCKGFGSGVAKAIKEKWPHVAEMHRLACNVNEGKGNEPANLLGCIQPVSVSDPMFYGDKYVVNMYAQENYGYDGAKYTSYDALDTCLSKLVTFCKDKGIKTVAFPYGMSSVRGGANWEVVMALINAHFGDTDIDVEIRRLEVA